MMLGAAPVLEPAHIGCLRAGDLHPVNAQIEGVLALAVRIRPLGDDERPCDQRCRLAGPAGLDRQFRKVNIVAGQNDVVDRT